MKTSKLPVFLAPGDFQRLIVAEVAPLWATHEHYRAPAFRWKLDFPNNHYVEAVASYGKMFDRAREGAMRRGELEEFEKRVKSLRGGYMMGAGPESVNGWHIPIIGYPGPRS